MPVQYHSLLSFQSLLPNETVEKPLFEPILLLQIGKIKLAALGCDSIPGYVRYGLWPLSVREPRFSAAEQPFFVLPQVAIA